MATSTLTTFPRRMRELSRVVFDSVSREVRAAGLAGLQVAIVETPKDTGRAAGGWGVDLVSPRPKDPGPTQAGPEAAAASALTDGAQRLSTWHAGEGSIYLTNGVPYIVPLDEGHSAQAPAGMTHSALSAIRARLARARLLKGD